MGSSESARTSGSPGGSQSMTSNSSYAGKIKIQTISQSILSSVLIEYIVISTELPGVTGVHRWHQGLKLNS